MAKKRRNVHNGGEQLPLIVPDSGWQRVAELPDLRRCKRIALDRETKDDGLRLGFGPGWVWPQTMGHVAGTAVAWREGGEMRSAYFPLRHPDTDNFDPEQVAQWERDHQAAGVEFVMQNGPYDVGWGTADGIPVPAKIQDTVAAANMVNEQRLSYRLNDLCKIYGIPGKDESLLREALEAYGWPSTGDAAKENIWRLPGRYAGPYGEQDAVSTLLLLEKLEPELEAQDLCEAYQLELDLIPLVNEMRRRGVRIDTDAAEQAIDVFEQRSREALDDLTDKLGQTVSIDELRRNSWLDETFTREKVPFPRVEGRGSFEAKWMRRVDHWLPQLVCRAKQADEAANKFLRNYVLGFCKNGRLHAVPNQFRGEEGAGTRTFRFSYSDPPLQQMPHRDDLAAKLIRGAFLAEIGRYWLSCDYSQQEYRWIVHFAFRMKCTRADQAVRRYNEDPRTDYHSMVSEMTGLERKPAKDCNFAKSYGAGKDKFAAMIGKSVDEAVRIMAQYDAEMPFVQELFDKCQQAAELKGFIYLVDRARIHFDKWEPTWLSREERNRGWNSQGKFKMGSCSREEAEDRVSMQGHPWHRKRLRRADCRKALNAKIQGTSARQTKKAMRACWRAGHVPMLQMHDELCFSVSEEREGAEISEIMRDIIKATVPFVVDAEYGQSWGQAVHPWAERGEPAE